MILVDIIVITTIIGIIIYVLVLNENDIKKYLYYLYDSY